MRAALAGLRDYFALPSGGDESTELARLVRIGLYILGAGVLGMVIWTILAPLSGAVIAQGFVKVDMNRKVVQHQEGGIVKEILVRDGARVKQGDPLVVLEDVRVDASLDLLRIQHDGERAKNARLQAESVFAPALKLPEDIEKRASGPGADPKVVEIVQRERALFRARREALESQVAVLRKQIVETGREIVALNAQVAAEEKALQLQRDELAQNEELVKQNYVAKTRIITLQRAVAEYEARNGEHRAEQSKAQQRVSELDLRILTMRNNYMQSATDELKDSTSKIFDLEERLRPTRDASVRQKIVAPATGEVVGMKVFTPGAVVGPREVLMEIVPEVQNLIIEARLRPDDINFVTAGTEADVRLTAFKRRTTPLVEGKVIYVSADRVLEPSGNAYYLVHVEVSAKSLAEAGNLKMLAGMPTDVYMRTDSRTPLDYLLAPVTDYLRRSMREPL